MSLDQFKVNNPKMYEPKHPFYMFNPARASGALTSRSEIEAKKKRQAKLVAALVAETYKDSEPEQSKTPKWMHEPENGKPCKCAWCKKVIRMEKSMKEWDK